MSAAERETSRVGVRSADGTSIAVWVAGEWPPLVLVHGSLCDHTRFDPLVAELGDGVTPFAMDRRGFGASRDASRYAIEREFEDVAAVVDAVADRTGEPVALAPTVVLTGSETPPAVREATDRAAAAISNAEIQVLEGHGHFAFQADPAMVAAVIRQFVAS